MERFSVSIEAELLKEFDQLIKNRGYSNRSEALRELMRKEILADEWIEGGEVAGAVIIVYDHHTRDAASEILRLQHEFSREIISNQHIHLDHRNCLEIIAVRGRAERIKDLYTSFRSIKGLKHASIQAAYSKKAL